MTRGIVRAGLLAGLALPTLASAQRRESAAGPRGEVRLDAIAARRSTVQLGGGFNVASGPYIRWGATAGVGATEHAGRTVATWRTDGVVRFVLDPFREGRRGLYGLAGLSVMDDGTRDVEPRLLLGLGVEGRAHGRAIPAVELALGGGVRLSGVVRRARTGRR